MYDVIVQSTIEYSFCLQPKPHVIEGLVLRLELLGEMVVWTFRKWSLVLGS